MVIRRRETRASGGMETGRLVQVEGLDEEMCPHCFSHDRSLLYEESMFVGLEIHAYFKCLFCKKRGLEVHRGSKMTVFKIL